MVVNTIFNVLARNGLKSPDGRPLHAYDVMDEERRELARLLGFRLPSGEIVRSTAMWFVLWAAETIRVEFTGGQLTWEFLFERLGMRYDRRAAIELTERGIAAFRRKLRYSDHGHRLFLYTLMAEGGLPDAALTDEGRYRTALLGLVREVERQGTLADAYAGLAAQRRVEDLPQAFRNEDSAKLMGELALGLAKLRQAVPEDLPPQAMVQWLDVHRPEWRRELPLRFSETSMETLIRPALNEERSDTRSASVAVKRCLRLRSDGRGWAGVAVVADGALLNHAALPETDQSLRLRLVLDDGPALLGVPADGGWRLQRSGGRGDIVMPLAPHKAVTLSAYSDGRLLGEAVLDPGLPEPLEAPSLWRPSDPQAPEAQELEPLPGRGRTRADVAWLLAATDVSPVAEHGVEIDAPVEGPGGRMWPMRGVGCVRVGDDLLALATGAETDDAPARLVPVGRVLAGWAASNGTQIFSGSPRVLGASADGILTSVESRIRRRTLPRILCGELVELVEDGAVVARLRLVALPSQAQLRLHEIENGRLSLRATHLQPGWHLTLSAGSRRVDAIVARDGHIDLDLHAEGSPPGIVALELAEPKTGRTLCLSGAWPARGGLIVDPDGARLVRNQPVSVARLAGWRGWLPDHGGTVQLKLAGEAAHVGFRTAGSIRLAAFDPVIRQMLALGGPDAQLNLRLMAGGTETARLELGRHDWQAEPAGPLQHLGPGRTQLFAVNLHSETQTAETEADGRIDLSGWLGDEPAAWFIQGHNDTRGVMRPFVWSPDPLPPSTRRERVEAYAATWRQLLYAPEDPRWRRMWRLISTVGEQGNVGALDQVFALAKVPAAGVALLLRAGRADLAEALALETATPLWWPTTPAEAWIEGVGCALRALTGELAGAGIEQAEALDQAAQAIQRKCGRIIALRPELAAHLGHALVANSVAPIGLDANGRAVPLAVPKPRAHLEQLAAEAAKRFDGLPRGARGVEACSITVGGALSDELRPLLDAPVVAAEAAAGLRLPLSPSDTVILLALRYADPTWFDAALPAALTLALEVSR